MSHEPDGTTAAEAEIQAHWEFYPCIVDDAPASILLNMWFHQNHESVDADTLYYGQIEMIDGDEHGMGSAEEADILFAAEDAITSAADDLGMFHVGRLRNHGMWQLTFYGPADKEDALGALFARECHERKVEIGSKLDTAWSYYHEFLFPDDERRQWMSNRRQVQTLADHGDAMHVPREVDHFLYFPSAAARGAFAGDLEESGFPAYELLEHAGEDDELFGIKVNRVDAVELNHIHDVVMELLNLAHEHTGAYDGWGSVIVEETSEESSDAN